MKYIYENEDGFTTYDRYFSYLETIKDVLPRHVYGFASDAGRYELRGPRTLHDSWIKEIIISHSRESSGLCSSLNLELLLLSQDHDKVHRLCYVNVSNYQFDNLCWEKGRHNDLLFHEVRFENGRIEHELVFDGKVRILIVCADMNYHELSLMEQ